MDWLHHPRFAAVRDAVINDLRRKEYHFRKVGTVVFLCGGANSPRRDRLAEYLTRHRPECLVFYAEAAWNVIALHDHTANALAVEEKLADLADIVVLIVESPGTFAELGAFAISPPLRRKLLPVMDGAHRTGQSFLETGPVRWVDVDSRFRPTIWGSHARILELTEEIEERLNRIPVKAGHRVPDLVGSPKHLLFFVCDLVAVFGPCPRHHIDSLLQQMLGTPAPDVTLFLGLGKALNLLRSFWLAGVEYFYRPLSNGRLPPFQYTGKYIDIPRLRARVLGVMLQCPPCAPILKRLADRQ